MYETEKRMREKEWCECVFVCVCECVFVYERDRERVSKSELLKKLKSRVFVRSFGKLQTGQRDIL